MPEDSLYNGLSDFARQQRKQCTHFYKMAMQAKTSDLETLGNLCAIIAIVNAVPVALDPNASLSEGPLALRACALYCSEPRGCMVPLFASLIIS